MASSDIVSPTGLDLSPAPPNPMRLSKKAGILFLATGAIVGGMILYGIVTRRDRQIKFGMEGGETKGITAATEAGRAVASKVPARPTGQSRDASATDELSTDQPQRQRNQPRSERPNPAAAQVQRSQNPPAPPGTAQYRELTPEERRRVLAYRREMEALDAPTASREGFTVSREAGAVASSGQGDMTQVTRLLQTLAGGGDSAKSGPSGLPIAAPAPPQIALRGGSPSEAEDYNLQNAQDQKEAFFEQVRSHKGENYRGAARTKALSRYEIKAGWDIPAILEQALNSDLPGEVKALVRENVYDTATGRYLLIPQGSRLVGVYDSRIAYGQDGVQVVWNRIIFPDASSMDLQSMAGQDAQGYSGLRHDVDSHYRRLIGTAALTSAFSVALQLSQTRRGTVFTYASPGEIAAGAAAGNLSEIGSDVTRRNLNIQPTIKVPIGYRFNIRVNRDLLFDAPYKPMQP
jgi:type IV secretion system protein VirB10